ncbi:MAG: pentapeptide repeat-containing protein [Anaerolineales bacterium]|nr:pentapeptide repeat-containing protein [Anaerolineales bacterium]
MSVQFENVLNRLHTTSNRKALQALDEMRSEGWLTDGTMQGVAFCRAPLQGANLEGANLCCAGFHQANLEAANLCGALLRAAKFSLCNLNGADLKDAKLENADFYKANLRGAQNLTDDQILSASRFLGATMPDGKRYDGRFSLFGDLALAEWNGVNTGDPHAMAEFYGVPFEVYAQGQGK